jgi:hypothetical protein
LPDTYSFCWGNVIDLKEMIYQIHVYKKDDPFCCLTGGKARAYLAIENNKFIIVKEKYLPDLN